MSKKPKHNVDSESGGQETLNFLVRVRGSERHALVRLVVGLMCSNLKNLLAAREKSPALLYSLL